MNTLDATLSNSPEFGGSLHGYERNPTDTPVIAAEHMPLLQAERSRAEVIADRILESNRKDNGEGLGIPAVDAIGSARRLIAAEADSVEQGELAEYLASDSQRYVGEVMRAKTWEYFPPLRHEWDDQAGLMTFGVPNQEITANGLSPLAPEEEVARRKNEYIENETHRGVAESGLGETHWCLTISMCTYDDIEGYDRNAQKMMLRGMHFEIDENGKCSGAYSEQIALKGHIFDDAFMNRMLQDMGVIDGNEVLDRTAIHNTQILLAKDTFSNVIDFVSYMDDMAGEGVFLGERSGEQIEYSDIPLVAAERQAFGADLAQKVSNKAIALAKDGIDPDLARVRLHAFVDAEAHKLCQQYPELSRDMFDEKTGHGYKEALILEVNGDGSAAANMREDVEANAPSVVACGNGSCGLETAKADIGLEVRSMGILQLENGGYLQDKERPCRNCRAKRIVYGRNGSVCMGCGMRKINGKLIPGWF